MSGPPDAVTPERILATLSAYQNSAALSAAIRLGLFTRIAEGADTLPALAARLEVPERSVRALANHLVAHTFLSKDGERYHCTPESATFLDERSPAYLGSVTDFQNSPGLVELFDDLVGVLRHGGTLGAGGGTTASENPVWVEFARAMQPMARRHATPVADVVCRGGVPRRVLDVAAGHGLYGIEVARRSATSELVSQDWAGVLEVARENARAAGLGARARTLPGSAFEVALGSGFDLVLVTNFLHHFARATCVDFLARCRAALAPGGRVAVVEFAVADDRVTPPSSAAFDLVMLATTPSGEAYTVSEYATMLQEAGLEPPERHDLPGGSHALFVAATAG